MTVQTHPLNVMAPIVQPEPGTRFLFVFDRMMDEGAIRDTCPEAKFISSAKSTARKLVFTEDGPSLIPQLGSVAYGVIWQIGESTLDDLDHRLEVPDRRERRGLFARDPNGRLIPCDFFAVIGAFAGARDPVEVLRVAELARAREFPLTYLAEIRAWLGAPVH